MNNLEFKIQPDQMDCGPTCLQMIAQYHGRYYNLETLRKHSHITREGVSLLGISDAAEAIGFRTMGVKAELKQLINEAPVPFIAHWNQEHFVVVYKIEKHKVWVADPAHGKVTYSKDEFIKCWSSTVDGGEAVGVCLLLEPTPEFYNREEEPLDKKGFSFLFKYLKPHKKFLVQLVLGLLVGSLLQLIFPFLTQAIVDVGINTQNVNFIYLILAAQLMLFISRMSVEFIRSWIMLHISTRINISLISDFLIKLMRLPIRFFDTKMTGDLIQRIEDHSRIEDFLTGQTLSVLFSMVNLLLFGVVLAYYNVQIFTVFLIGSILYFVWVYLFMHKRRDIDYNRFAQMSSEQSNLIQMITGMQEIKLNNCEKQKRWEWERIQARLFRVNVQSLSLSQYQQLGGLFFNEIKNIIITVLAAFAVVKGEMTLGMMLSVQYILGQLNSPIDQMISFVHSAQDAKISLERLGEIHNKEDEEGAEADRLTELPSNKDLSIKNVSFQYEGPHSPKVLDAVNIHIPSKKVTAIVGTSGNGKTTLIKMLLGFYNPTNGEIKVGDNTLDNFNQGWWRSKCGVVMQDGFIFSDTIAKNIAVSDEYVNKERLLYAVKVAHIQEYIDGLPLGYNTKIGQEGVGLSQGQKQRILIARAVYKDPEYIFLDEATNALDANNEKIIMENLDQFFKGRTVIVVAHRLSTVRNADQIIVIEKGKIVEQGVHHQLVDNSGAYFNLVKNQLELGG
ncbi:peptidase domain-containing ABC transporter [Saccharicrinis aurantiacus]|uniref:peptidase domain-containing ABC transporter n=1 Tax=Saccharicrinis aurantiacus TaxID=1849719 RepID=UPI00249271BF|nr:peptidase domain-containing ABC transporter [Saccharicrinis aurantiacus]